MGRWYVSEQSIYDENGQQVIEASEWFMRGNLQTICDEHNKSNKPIENQPEYIKEQFIKIEDARIAICEAMKNDCKLCPLNDVDKCGDIKNLGIFNAKTMKLESVDEYHTTAREGNRG
jgi:hypothetical protein